MPAPPALGTVNGRVTTRASVDGKPFLFDGTTVGLAIAAVEAGGKPGDTVLAYYLREPHVYALVPAPHDKRVPGLWPDRIYAAA